MQHLDLVSREDRGYVAELTPFSSLPPALRFCVHVPDDGGPPSSLAQLFKRVPVKYLGEASDRKTRQVRRVAWCPCGAAAVLVDWMTECPGACRRWFVADVSGVFAARFPKAEAFDERTRTWLGEAA